MSSMVSNIRGLCSCLPSAWNTLTPYISQGSPEKQPVGCIYMCVCVYGVHALSCVWCFASPWTVALQAPLSMGFSRQEYWSGLPFPSPGDLPDPGIEPASLASPALPGGFFTTELPRKIRTTLCTNYCYSQFTDENTETQRHEIICPKSHSEVKGQREGKLDLCMLLLHYFFHLMDMNSEILSFSSLQSTVLPPFKRVCSGILQDETLHLFRKYLLSAHLHTSFSHSQRFLESLLCVRYWSGCWGYISEKPTHRCAVELTFYKGQKDSKHK